MKHITIVVSNELESTSSITGLFEVLDFANEHWKSVGNKAGIDIFLQEIGIPLYANAQKQLYLVQRY